MVAWKRTAQGEKSYSARLRRELGVEGRSLSPLSDDTGDYDHQFGGLDRLADVHLEAGAERLQPVFAPRLRGQSDGRNLDRKSTRLNSSHLGISYAVFCLKK